MKNKADQHSVLQHSTGAGFSTVVSKAACADSRGLHHRVELCWEPWKMTGLLLGKHSSILFVKLDFPSAVITTR